jgi:hypothetical protein
MSNLPVISKLLQDNPDLLTPEGLSALLHDCICLKYAQHHRFTYPSLLHDKSIYLELAQLGSSNAEEAEISYHFKASSKIGAANGCDSQEEVADFLHLFRKIRDNIHQLQQDLSISGVSQRHISIRDRLFTFPTAEDQLLLLESDRLTLQNAVPEITKYFLQIVQMLPAYNLFLVDENEKKIPTTVAVIENAASGAVKAEIYSESYNWELTGANCWHGKHAYKVDPDEIHLCLHLDWDEEESIYIDAHHPDSSRSPWADEPVH